MTLINTTCPAFSLGTSLMVTSLKSFNAEYNQFKDGLTAWCNEQSGSPEYGHRIQAKRIIIDCYKCQSATLYLNGLGLSSIPPAIYFLYSLRSIHLQNNQLTSLPPEIYELENLELLDLRDNCLKRLPSGIDNLRNLRKLLLDKNPISGVPIDLILMKERCKISLLGCPVPDSLFSEIHTLNNL